jgi:hypothetical protein
MVELAALIIVVWFGVPLVLCALALVVNTVWAVVDSVAESKNEKKTEEDIHRNFFRKE